MNQLKLLNKKIIISAAANGIGWSIAQECMLNGAIIYITDKNKESRNNHEVAKMRRGGQKNEEQGSLEEFFVDSF